MVLTLDFSDEAEATLRSVFGDVDQAAKDALIIEGYRSGRLSLGDVRRLLNLATRQEAESWLGGRGVAWNYNLEELEADRRTVRDLLGVQL